MPSWIDRFQEYLQDINSPALFTKWAGIFTIAATLERKVYCFTRGSNLYPNLYTIFVAPPGIGKTAVVRSVRDMLSTLPHTHIAPSSVTKASLIDAFDKASRHITRPEKVPAVLSYKALSIISNELGVLLPAYDSEMMNTLTDLFDGIGYTETRRTKNLEIQLKNPCLNILAAATPSYLAGAMPEGAWDQGFAARLILIYSGESIVSSLFKQPEGNKELREWLVDDLKRIDELEGEFFFTQEAMIALDNWLMNGCPPAPDHPKLHHYNTRRIVHVLKLSMICAASSGSQLLITLDHVQEALDWLLEAEAYMPDIFKSMSGTTHSQLIDEVWHFVFSTNGKNGQKGVAEARLINFLQQRTPAHNVTRVLEVMERSGIIIRRLGAVQGGTTGNFYFPGGRD